MSPKVPPERREIFIWIRVLQVEVALERLGKDILKDKRFGLKKMGLTNRRRRGSRVWGGDFAPPSGFKTLRWRFLKGCWSHFEGLFSFQNAHPL